MMRENDSVDAHIDFVCCFDGGERVGEVVKGTSPENIVIRLFFSVLVMWRFFFFFLVVGKGRRGGGGGGVALGL